MIGNMGYQLKKCGLLLLSVIFLWSCSPEDKSTRMDAALTKHLRIVSIYAPAIFDPHLEPNWFMINSGAVETLVRVDEQLTLQPWILKDWQTPDGQHWELTLKPQVTFQNGQPVTANAVKASLERSIALNKAVKAALRIQSIKAQGNTLTITTDNIHPTFISELVHPNTVIVDVNTADMAENPVGTGPYKVESVKSMVGMELVRNPYYWDGVVPLDRISFKANTDANARLLAFQAGEVEILYRPSVESLDTLKKMKHVIVDSVDGARVYYLLHNYQGPNAKWMSNRAFRQGLDALIDRQAIVNSVFHQQGTIALGPFVAGSSYAPQYTPKNYSIEEALNFFQTAGLNVRDGKVSDQGQPISLHLAVYTARPEFPVIAQIYQDSARKVGIHLTIQVVERIEEYLPNAQWDLATYALVTVPRGDASYFFNAACYPGRFLNFGQMDVPEFNQLVEQINITTESTMRDALIQSLGRMIDEERYHAFYMVNPKVTTAYHQKVKGWVTYPHDLYLITKNIRID